MSEDDNKIAGTEFNVDDVIVVEYDANTGTVETPLIAEAIANTDVSDVEMTVTDESQAVMLGSDAEKAPETITKQEIDGDGYMKVSDVQEYMKTEFAKMYKTTVAKEQLETDARREVEDAARDEFVALMKKSPEPWVELVSFRVDDDGQIRTEVDWNDAFIMELRNNKYEGITEEELVQKWLLLLATNAAEEIA